jgi:hypothetical protein
LTAACVKIVSHVLRLELEPIDPCLGTIQLVCLGLAADGKLKPSKCVVGPVAGLAKQTKQKCIRDAPQVRLLHDELVDLIAGCSTGQGLVHS